MHICLAAGLRGAAPAGGGNAKDSPSPLSHVPPPRAAMHITFFFRGVASALTPSDAT